MLHYKAAGLQVFIRKHDEGAIPVAMVGIAAPPDIADIYSVIENEIQKPLERIDGVATVGTDGLIEKEVLIELDRSRVEAAGLNIFEIAQDLSQDNFTMASGSVRSADKKLLLRSVARFGTPDSVGDLQIAPSIRLSDIATVRYAQPETEFLVRVNSKPAWAMMVMKEAEANTMDVSRRVGALVADFQTNPRLRDIEIDLIMDQGELIGDSLSVLIGSGRVGAIFAMLVLLFFLRRFRLSLIIGLSIPLSMVVALVVMYFAGETLNVLTLLALMISVGLLVDNAVVVAENIHRIHRDEGLSRRDAVVKGTGQIAMAITTATLTTVVVFLPVALVEGMAQFFLLRLSIPIAVSLLASLFVAMVVIPLAVYMTLPRGQISDKGPGLFKRAHLVMNTVLRRAYDMTFGWLNRAYGALLDVALKRRLETVIALIAVLGLTQVAAKDRINVTPMSEDDQAFFEIDVRLPDSLTFEEGTEYFLKVEKLLEAKKDELELEFYMFFQSKRWGEVQGALAANAELGPREVTEKIVAELPELPGLEVTTGMMSEGDESDELATHTVMLFGENAELLDEVAKNLEPRFLQIEGVLGRKNNGQEAPNEIALKLDRSRAQDQGVNPQTLAGVVGSALRGQSLPRVYYGGRDIPVRVRYEEADRESLADLQNFRVPTATGTTVGLASIVDVERLPSATRIFRRDKRTALRMVFELEKDQEEEAKARLMALLPNIDLPEGVTFGDRGRNPFAAELGNLGFAVTLSIVFVYLLMGFLFESFLLPLSILVTIPLANVGVMWIHMLTGRDMDMLGFVGIIILIGVVVNNGIVLLDYVLRLRAEGMDRAEAIRTAARRRFRPIMMTALTTICGMVPLTVGEPTRMGLSYASFGLTLIGGMVTASFLTLLVVPVFYTLFEDARTAVSGALLRVLRGRGTQETVTAFHPEAS